MNETKKWEYYKKLAYYENINTEKVIKFFNQDKNKILTNNNPLKQFKIKKNKQSILSP